MQLVQSWKKKIQKSIYSKSAHFGFVLTNSFIFFYFKLKIHQKSGHISRKLLSTLRVNKQFVNSNLNPIINHIVAGVSKRAEEMLGIIAKPPSNRQKLSLTAMVTFGLEFYFRPCSRMFWC